MGIDLVEQLTAPGYLRADFDMSSVPLEIRNEVEEYKKVKAFVVELEKASKTPGAEGIVTWEKTMEILGMSVEQYGMVEKGSDLSTVLHMGLGTEVEQVKGIGVGRDGITKENIYLGYSKDFPIVSGESSVTRELWHFIPRVDYYPAISMRVIPYGTTVALWVAEGKSREEKSRLVEYYKRKDLDGDVQIPEVSVSVDEYYTPPYPDDRDFLSYSVESPEEEAMGEIVALIESSTPAVAIQEEHILQVKIAEEVPLPQKEKIRFSTPPGEEDIKPKTPQQKAWALFNRLEQIRRPEYDQWGVKVRSAKFSLDPKEVIEVLEIPEGEITTSDRNPFLFLQVVMDRYFPEVNNLVERVWQGRKGKGTFRWVVRTAPGSNDAIVISLASPKKGGKWTAGSLEVDYNEKVPMNVAKREIGKAQKLKTAVNRTKSDNSTFVQAPLFANP